MSKTNGKPVHHKPKRRIVQGGFDKGKMDALMDSLRVEWEGKKAEKGAGKEDADREVGGG